MSFNFSINNFRSKYNLWSRKKARCFDQETIKERIAQ